MSMGSLLRRWGPVAVIVGAIAIAVQQGWFGYLTLERVAANRDWLVGLAGDRYAAALAAFVAVYVAVVALSIPGAALLTMLGGFLFGWLVGALAVVVAATAGATLIFLVARTSLGEALAARAGPRLDRLRDGFQRDALSYLLFLRLVPLFPFWLVNLAPALLGMRVGPYMLGTFVGIIPGTLAFAFLGAGLDSVIAAERAEFEACIARKGAGGACEFALDPASVLTPELIVAFVALGIVALIPVAARYIRRRKAD